MAEYLIQDTTLTEIADAIRAKTGSSDSVAVSGMASQIEGITVSNGSDVTVVENVSIELDFSGGDQVVSAGDGYAVRTATILMPETLTPENIAEGIEIAGIVGTHAGSTGSTGSTGAVDGCVTVTFMNGDTVLFSRPVYIGDDCPNPIAQGHITETPTKESTAQYDYTYSGWCAADGGTADSTILKSITEDKIIYAAYTAAVRYYTVTFYDDDGTTVLTTKEIAYGSKPSYVPTKSGFVLTGWTPEITAVTGDASYTAVWGDVLVVIPEQTVSMTRTFAGYPTYSGTFTAQGATLADGATYKVLFDGTEYTVTYMASGNYYAYYKTSSAGTEWKWVVGFGNPFEYEYWENSSGKLCTLQKITDTLNTSDTAAMTDNGLPFYINYYSGGTSGTLYVTDDSSATHTIYVYQKAE